MVFQDISPPGGIFLLEKSSTLRKDTPRVRHQELRLGDIIRLQNVRPGEKKKGRGARTG